VKRILSTDEDEVMPPPHTKKVLSDKDKATLKAWIAEGAKYEAHWAYSPPKPSKDPKASIDHFIRERLEKEGLKPSPEADPYTLVRRVYLDLIGLPPTPAEADAFVQSQSVNPVKPTKSLVDTLLNSKPIRRTLGAPLARSRTLRRHERLRERPPAPDLALP
jgi:hypothetical protein